MANFSSQDEYYLYSLRFSENISYTDIDDATTDVQTAIRNLEAQMGTGSGASEDHTHDDYLTEASHDLLDADNPHSVTFTQAVAADGLTDITAAEAETLTAGPASDADLLHTHPAISAGFTTDRLTTTATGREIVYSDDGAGTKLVADTGNLEIDTAGGTVTVEDKLTSTGTFTAEGTARFQGSTFVYDTKSLSWGTSADVQSSYAGSGNLVFTNAVSAKYEFQDEDLVITDGEIDVHGSTALSDGNDASSLHNHGSIYYTETEIDTNYGSLIDGSLLVAEHKHSLLWSTPAAGTTLSLSDDGVDQNLDGNTGILKITGGSSIALYGDVAIAAGDLDHTGSGLSLTDGNEIADTLHTHDDIYYTETEIDAHTHAELTSTANDFTWTLTDDGTDADLELSSGDMTFTIPGGDVTFAAATVSADKYVVNQEPTSPSGLYSDYNAVEIAMDYDMTGFTPFDKHAVDIDMVANVISGSHAIPDVHGVDVNMAITHTDGTFFGSVRPVNIVLDIASGVSIGTPEGALVMDATANATTGAGLFGSGVLNVQGHAYGSGSGSSFAARTVMFMEASSSASTGAGYQGYCDGTGTFTGTAIGVWGYTANLTTTSKTIGVIGHPDAAGTDHPTDRADVIGVKSVGSMWCSEGDLAVTQELKGFGNTLNTLIIDIPDHWSYGDEAGHGYFKGKLEVDSAVYWDSVVHWASVDPDELTDDEDDWVVIDGGTSAAASIIRMTSDALGPHTIGSIAGAYPGRHLILINISADIIKLADESQTLGTATNRVILGTAGNELDIEQHDTVHLWYDGTTGRWRVL